MYTTHIFKKTVMMESTEEIIPGVRIVVSFVSQLVPMMTIIGFLWLIYRMGHLSGEIYAEKRVWDLLKEHHTVSGLGTGCWLVERKDKVMRRRKRERAEGEPEELC